MRATAGPLGDPRPNYRHRYIITKIRRGIGSESVLRVAAGHIVVGAAVVGVANLLGGLLASAIGAVDLVVYLLVLRPALYIALVYVLRGFGLFLEDVRDGTTNGTDVALPFDGYGASDRAD